MYDVLYILWVEKIQRGLVMSTFDILISCMNEKPYNIVFRSNIRCNCVVINQCNEEKLITKNNVLWMNSKDIGLSKSRNLAIKISKADICLLADNDEIFIDNVDKVVMDAYNGIPEADIIIFEIKNRRSKLKNKIYQLKKFDLLRVSSWQITFRRKKIVDNLLAFDELLGSGTINGSGEENKFLFDAYYKGLKIYHCPIDIAYMIDDNKSIWFNGYSESYFYRRGIITRYILGFWISLLYAFYFILNKRNLYCHDITMIKALQNVIKGIFVRIR